MFSTIGFHFLKQYFCYWFFLRLVKYWKHQFLWNKYIVVKLRNLFISKIFIWSQYFERTWVWWELLSSALHSDHKWLHAQLGLIITSSSALWFDQRQLRAQLGLIITSSSALGSDHKCFQTQHGSNQDHFERLIFRFFNERCCLCQEATIEQPSGQRLI